ncbi:InlB B-repeat-containing protein [Aurantimicrobium sp. MWH-Uga1]|uniref:InlB B-repeat-containing protein n=1 Tax=Aurantimicrobium sp. MWH-Uga1 TaxID=2079575 RepID=UPI000DEDE318|nr:InlB B-repeat-containing protein [Aurantimicrobium sp. MWH-Uga1]AXE54296.1 Internalin-A precursor [Aurantimicrobium sp. MWH-Uga1]
MKKLGTLLGRMPLNRLFTRGVAISLIAGFGFFLPGNLTAAYAAALPLPAATNLYYVNYTAGATPLNQITGVSAGTLTTSSVCTGTCSGALDQSSGGFYNSSDNSIYTATSAGGIRFTLQKFALSGSNAGVPITVGTSGAQDIFGMAKGPQGVFGLGNGLYPVDISNGSLGTGIPLTGDAPANQTWNGFAYNPVDGLYYMMNRADSKLYRINVTTGATSQVGTSAITGVSGSYSLQIDSTGTFWVLDPSSKLSTFTVSGNVISAATQQGTLAAFATVAMVMAPLTYTVTYQHGTGATGADLVQTIAQGSALTLPSPIACPLSATDPCFTAPSGQRQNGWEVTSGTLSSGSSFPSTGQSVTPTSNVVLKARWTGGPVQYSTTSFLTTPNPMASIAFPNTAVGSSSQITIYAYNSGSASTSISNETVGGTGVSRQGGSCNASGGTIAAGSECTVILQWNPSAAGALLNGSYSMQVSGSYFDAVTLTGTAATPYTVTFNPGGGTGTMGNQTAAGPNNLNANSFTKAGYTFRYWSTFSDGSGTTYLNQGQYPFSGNATLFAQWLADSHVVTYNTQGGSAVSNGTFLTGATMALPAAPTKSGYTFDGWFTSATGGTALTSPYTPGVITDITLYAQWSVDTSANGSSSSTSGLPHTGSNGESLIGFASLLFLGGITLLAIAIIRRRSV